jgi:RNA polymerase sigma-70 factor (ECF subfamily)
MKGRSSLTDDFEDVCQEVALKALMKLGGFRGACPLPSWILTVALNETNDFLREEHSKKRDAGQTDYFEEMLGSEERLPSKTLSPEEAAIRENEAHNLHEAMDRLSPQEKALVQMHHLESYAISEIAEIFDMNENTVRTKLSRARKKLARHLRQ